MSLVPAHRLATLVATLLLASLGTACGGDGGGSGPSGRRLALAPGQPDSQVVDPSQDVAIAPSVRVTDASGEPVANVRVTFTPAAGSGSVTAGTPVTNAQGIATVGSWRAGDGEGRQTLVASAAGSSDRVTFVANAVSGGSDPCAQLVPYALTGTVSGSLASTDCRFDDGSYVDLYDISTASAVNHEIRMSSTSIDTFLWLWQPDGDILGLVDDTYETNAAIRLIAPAGSYVLGANSFEPSDFGTYTLTTTTGARPAGCAENTFVRPGASWSESIASTDCAAAEAGAGTWEDVFYIALDPGQSVTVTFASSAFDPYLRLYGRSGAIAADDNSGGGTTARLTLTPNQTFRDFYAIVPTSRLANQQGAYTIQVAPATASLAAAPAAAPRWWRTPFARPAKGTRALRAWVTATAAR